MEVKKQELKTWRTAGLVKSSRYKSRLFKNIIRHYDFKKFEYKCYCDVLHRIIERAKRNYYNDLVLDKNVSNKL